MDAFTMLATFGNIVEKQLGRNWVLRIAEELELDSGIFRNTGYKHILASAIASEKGMKGFGRMIQGILHSVEMDVSLDFSRRFLLDMANTGSIVDALDMLFNRRKKYWTNRYRRKSRMYVNNIVEKDVKECVKYQLLSKCFDAVEFLISEDHSITWERMPVEKALCASAHHFATKRCKKNMNPKLVVEPVARWNEIKRDELDKWVKKTCGKDSKVPYSEVATFTETRLDEFVDDVRSIYRRVVTHDDVEEDELPQKDDEDDFDISDYSSDEEPPEEPPMIKTRADFEDVDVVNPVKEDLPPKGNTIAMFDDEDDFDDDEVGEEDVDYDEEGNAIYYYILREDLYDDIPRITERVIEELVAKWGEKVPMTDMEQVKKEAGALATRYAAQMQQRRDELPDLE